MAAESDNTRGFVAVVLSRMIVGGVATYIRFIITMNADNTLARRTYAVCVYECI